MTIDRRKLIHAAGGLTLLAGIGGSSAWAQTSSAYPFTLGVASGDPAPDGFVIWTRLAPRPLELGSGMPKRAVPVRWEVAEDDRFSRIAATGEALARPELGHSVHVEVGGLRPGARYWYRFSAGGEASGVGTVRTAPAAGAQLDRLRLGVAGCQHYEAGLYTAYKWLSQEPDLDAIFHYGDYIYEGPEKRGCPVTSTDGERTRTCFRQHVGDEIYTLDDYRRRYAQYKTDPDLQAAHAAAAFLSTYDDHEVDNNWAGEADQDGTPPEIFALRRSAALQAWYENMPVRRAQFPAGGALRMRRRLDYGDLLRIHLLDTRQYRAAPSILGAEQQAWLEQGLGGGARWNLVAQQVMVMPFLYPESRAAGRTNTDSWSGYPASRERLVQTIAAQKLGNVVIATGDVHKHHAGVLPARAGDLDGPAAATEFVCTSISSGGDGAVMDAGWEGVAAANPHCRLTDARRGYQVFEVGRDSWLTDVKVVDRVTTLGGRVSTAARFAVQRGKPGLASA